MSAVELFTYPETGQPIRTVTLHGDPWFVAKDACDVLGISKHRDAVAGLDPDERASTAVDTPGGRQAMSVVSEPGLYALMMISRSPKARQFQRWVNHDVLPSIRKTGGYAAVAAPAKRELSKLEVLEMAIESERRALAAETRNAELEPKAAQADHFRQADGLLAIAQFCNDLALYAREHHRVKLLHDQVRDFLGEIGMVIRSKSIRRNEPTAAALKSGLMRAKHDTIERSTGPQAKVSARLTPKGWSHAWDKALARLAAHGSLDRPRAIERQPA